ncbi:unnamed protein product, partial [Arctogadus glacialis]
AQPRLSAERGHGRTAWACPGSAGGAAGPRAAEPRRTGGATCQDGLERGEPVPEVVTRFSKGPHPQAVRGPATLLVCCAHRAVSSSTLS